MILRIYTGRVAPGREADLDEYLRSRAIPAALEVPGLVSFQPGVRERAGRFELSIVSTWTDFDALISVGRNLDTPVAMAGASDMMEDGSSDHFELVDGGARGLPFAGTSLVIRRGRLRTGMGSSFFAEARREADPLLDNAALVGLHLGRRIVDGVEEVVSATMWADPEASKQANVLGDWSPRHGDEPYFGDDDLHDERYRAMSVTHPTTDAPALLLADDQRRYLHATPAAARLTGISVARLLSMRVEDLATPDLRDAVPELWRGFLAEGSLDGPFVLRHRDGREVPVLFSARARSPWPGCHASVLSPATAAPVDFDAALSAAGFVSRYAEGI